MTSSQQATIHRYSVDNHCPGCGAHLSEPCSPTCPLGDEVELAAETTEVDFTGVACTICGEDLGRSDHTQGCPDRGRFNNQL